MKKELELYLHIPFCIQKCKYCDFLSAPCNEELRENYVKSLCRKIRSYQELAEAYHVVSIFLGGGTPSVLKAGQTREIFRAVQETFEIDADAEITTELNPGTVTEEKLQTYRELGINRLSIGLQTVNDEELRLLGRIHTYNEFEQTYQMARKLGFQNINIDLISAIPGQTVESWQKTLRTVADLEPEHISAYSLIIEEGTPFYEIYGDAENTAHDYAESECLKQNLYTKQYAPLPDEDAERQMYQDTQTILREYGYHRYEISNYAKEGYECQHNLGYWERREYLGIGLGAASLINNERWNEVDDLEQFCADEKPESVSLEALDENAQMEECMFLGFRKIKGVSVKEFSHQFGKQIEEIYGEEIKKLRKQNLLEWEEDYIRLTEYGLDVSNYVMSQFIR